MKTKPLIALLLATVVLTAAAPAFAQAKPEAQAAAPGDGPEDAKLKRFFFERDEAELKRNPISGIFRGDLRYADQLGDWLTDARTAREKQALLDNLAGLKRIDRARLTHIDQIAYDVFRQQNEVGLKSYAPAILRIDRVLPIDHFNGFQTFYPDFASG